MKRAKDLLFSKSLEFEHLRKMYLLVFCSSKRVLNRF